ncbi:MAG: hypothetical protein COA63_004205 [Methylophaga sp.]|nr:hypothetical protein [Methylophaga sp.]
MSSVAKFIVRQHRPYFYVMILIASIALTFLIQRYVYLKETQVQQQKIKEYQQLNDLYQQLRNKSEEMGKYISLSDVRLESNKYELDLQKATIQQLEQQIGQQQNQLAAFNKELLFYQTITQGDRPNKLQIRELVLRSDAANSDIVHYRLVITQGKKINQALTGTIEMVSNISEEQSLVIAEHSLNLRHVQLIEGQINIIGNEIPKSITITIKQKKKTLLSQSFDWQLSPHPE